MRATVLLTLGLWQTGGSAAEFRHLEGHKQPVYAVAWTADGTRLVSGSFDRTVKVWDVAAQRTLRTLTDHTHLVLAVAVSSDGKQLASAGLDRQIYLYDMPSVRPTVDLANDQQVQRLAATADGKWLVAATADGRLLRYAADTGQLAGAWPLAPPSAAGTAAAVPVGIAANADGSVVAMATADGGLYAAYGATVERRQSLATPEPIAAVAVRADLQATAIGSPSGKVRLYRWPPPPPRELAVGVAELRLLAAPDGSWLAAYGAAPQVKLFTVADGKPKATLDHGGAVVRSAAVARDGGQLATVAADGNLRIWNAADGALAHTLALGSTEAMAVAALPEPQRWLVTGQSGDATRVWQFDLAASTTAATASAGNVPVDGGAVSLLLAGGQTLAAVRGQNVELWTTAALLGEVQAHTGAVAALQFSSRGGQLVSTGADGQIVLWRTSNLTEIRRLAGGPPAVDALAADGPGRWIAAAAPHSDGGGEIRLWQATDGEPLPSIRTAQRVASLGLTEDGAHLHVGLADGELATYQIADGARLEARRTGGPIAMLHVSPDGRWLTTLTGAAPGGAVAPSRIQRWDVASWSPRQRLSGHTAHVYGLDFSPDGARLASAGADQLVKLWNTADGANYATAKGHASPVYAVAFRPDGQQLASGGLDRTLRLWNPADGALQREWKEDLADGLYALAYARDGGALFSAGLAQTWQQWEAAQDKPVRTISGHSDAIYRVAPNPAGTRLATLGYTGQLKLWDLASGGPLHEEQLPVTAAYSLAWSPDGAELALATIDHRVLLWRVPETAR